MIRSFIDELDMLMAPESVRVYSTQLTVWTKWLKWEGRLALKHLSRALLRDFWAHLRHDRKVTKATANRMVRLVWRWWDWAYDHDEYGDFTPRTRKVRLPRAEPAKPTRAPSWAEMDAAITQAQNEDHRRLMVLLRCTGLRVGQVAQLQWSDVDLPNQELTVRPELGKTHAEQAGRVVPMAPALVEEMEGWQQREGHLVDGYTLSTYRSWTLEAWEHADIDPAIWQQRPHHAFRKGFRTGLHAGGATERAAEFLVGHDMGIVGVYVDPQALDLQGAVLIVPPLGDTPHKPPGSYNGAEKQNGGL